MYAAGSIFSFCPVYLVFLRLSGRAPSGYHAFSRLLRERLCSIGVLVGLQAFGRKVEVSTWCGIGIANVLCRFCVQVEFAFPSRVQRTGRRIAVLLILRRINCALTFEREIFGFCVPMVNVHRRAIGFQSRSGRASAWSVTFGSNVLLRRAFRRNAYRVVVNACGQRINRLRRTNRVIRTGVGLVVSGHADVVPRLIRRLSFRLSLGRVVEASLERVAKVRRRRVFIFAALFFRGDYPARRAHLSNRCHVERVENGKFSAAVRIIHVGCVRFFCQLHSRRARRRTHRAWAVCLFRLFSVFRLSTLAFVLPSAYRIAGYPFYSRYFA